MITAEQIPEAVAHAAEAAWSRGATWKEVVAAAMNAWRGMTTGEEIITTARGSFGLSVGVVHQINLPIEKPLGADFEKVWDDNADELYED